MYTPAFCVSFLQDLLNALFFTTEYHITSLLLLCNYHFSPFKLLAHYFVFHRFPMLLQGSTSPTQIAFPEQWGGRQILNKRILKKKKNQLQCNKAELPLKQGLRVMA